MFASAFLHCGGDGGAGAGSDGAPQGSDASARSDGGGAGGDAGTAADAGAPGCTDGDGDGFGVGADCAEVDCDDTSIDSHPGAAEVCDGADNDCDGEVDVDCACPLLTYDCAAGCCDLASEQVTPGYGRYPDVTLDADGNLYVAYAIPNSGAWESGMSVHTRATSEWSHVTETGGSNKSQVAVGETGRIHHLYARYQGAIHYRYSDTQGDSWTEIPDIPGALDIGGTCSMAIDSADRPHLYCGIDHDYPNEDKPNYIYWDGSSWQNEMLELYASTYDDAELNLGFMDRPHIVHTYGPDDEVDLHYTYYTGVQWVTEPVPLPQGVTVHPDRNPGVALDGDDTLHIAFTAVDDEGDFAAWYARRTAAGDWTFEEALPAADLGGSDWGDCVLELRPDGTPVFFTEFGSGARRTSSGWMVYQVDHRVDALALRAGLAYLVFETDEGAEPLHLDIVDLFP